MTKVDPFKYRSNFECLMSELERPKYVKQQHNKGAALAREGMILHVGSNGLFWADSPDSLRHVQHFERLGYHTLADAYLQGFLVAGGTCMFHGFDGIQGQVTL